MNSPYGAFVKNSYNQLDVQPPVCKMAGSLLSTGRNSMTAKTNGTDFNSTNIDSYDYDASAETLEVAFITGGKYVYRGVPQDTVSALDSAESKTKFLNESIRNKFETEKL
ncbi:MAG: KTSC domain-containing protein [Verrucomicrobiaceae bacterium]|nr:MAG: KTSC domain-containing protein [Verrucomicrobiaceae bacterium]